MPAMPCRRRRFSPNLDLDQRIDAGRGGGAGAIEAAALDDSVVALGTGAAGVYIGVVDSCAGVGA